MKVLFVSIMILLSACGQPQSVTERISPEKEAEAKSLILKEKKVKDLMYDPELAVQWHVGVLDDGSKRYGYAAYICQLLNDIGVINDKTIVRIVDVVKIKQGETLRSASLGSAKCATLTPFD